MSRYSHNGMLARRKQLPLVLAAYLRGLSGNLKWFQTMAVSLAGTHGARRILITQDAVALPRKGKWGPVSETWTKLDGKDEAGCRRWILDY